MKPNLACLRLRKIKLERTFAVERDPRALADFQPGGVLSEFHVACEGHLPWIARRQRGKILVDEAFEARAITLRRGRCRSGTRWKREAGKESATASNDI